MMLFISKIRAVMLGQLVRMSLILVQKTKLDAENAALAMDRSVIWRVVFLFVDSLNARQGNILQNELVAFHCYLNFVLSLFYFLFSEL
jgi:hypothetical protein